MGAAGAVDRSLNKDPGLALQGESPGLFIFNKGWSMRGIDVSSSNGVIGWDKVKTDFAIVRCGYGNDDPGQDDKQFARNVSECVRLGVPWGAYLYSYAMSMSDAESEAKHILRLLEGKAPDLPVYIDMEDADGYKAKRGGLSKKLATDICVQVCERVKAAGYTPGVYANLDWTRNHLEMGRLAPYEFWLAQYNDKVTYAGEYGIWQYTSKGIMDGINGNVDLNICYKDYLCKVAWDTKSKVMMPGSSYAALCMAKSGRAEVKVDNPEICAIEGHRPGYTARNGKTGDLYTLRAIKPGTCSVTAALDGSSASFPVTVEV